MAAAMLQLGCTIQCPHGGMVNPVTANSRVRAGGAFVLLVSDTFPVAGCPFTLPGPKPSPCVLVQWQLPAQRVTVNGQAVLLETSIGLCKSAEGLVQGTALVSGVQTSAKGM